MSPRVVVHIVGIVCIEFMWSSSSIFFCLFGTVSAATGCVALCRAWSHGWRPMSGTTPTAKGGWPSQITSVMDGVGDAVFGVSQTGKISYANPAAAKLLGRDAAEFIGVAIEHVVTTADHAAGALIMQGTLTGQNGLVAMEVTRSPLPLANGSRGELLICRETGRPADGDRFVHDERDILESIAANQPLDEVVDRVAACVARLRGGLRAAVIVRREGVTHCLGGLPTETRRAVERVDAIAAPVSWWTSPRVLEDVQSDPIFAASLPGFRVAGIRSCWSFPIVPATSVEAVGVLLMFPAVQGAPDAADLQLINRCSKLIRLAIDREHMADQLATRSLHDALTGLPNRMLTSDRLGHAIKRARRAGTQLATLLIDLDGFKAINDNLGNQNGDLLLKQVADRLKMAIRSSDTLGRFGNDQFTLVASDITENSIGIICDRLLSAFKQPFDSCGQQMTLTASIGISGYPADGDDVNALLRNADTALVHAKQQNRGGYRVFEAYMNEATLERVELENQLRTAIQNNELVIFYQPQCDVTGRVVGVEALIRWRRNGVLIPPLKFIPIAEESGMIVPIGTWVLRESCRWCKDWQSSGRSPLRVAVNVSALQFAQDDFVQVVRQTLEETQLDPTWLEVEVTESLLMHNTKNVAGKLEKLREMGVAVAIDDFGTGYSSLAYLQKLPIDILKIDRSFVKDIPNADDTTDKTAVIRAILSMAHSLQLKVIAEGVETDTHRQFLRQAGCHLMQGYFFSPAKATDEIVDVIERLNRNAMTISQAA